MDLHEEEQRRKQREDVGPTDEPLGGQPREETHLNPEPDSVWQAWPAVPKRPADREQPRGAPRETQLSAKGKGPDPQSGNDCEAQPLCEDEALAWLHRLDSGTSANARAVRTEP